MGPYLGSLSLPPPLQLRRVSVRPGWLIPAQLPRLPPPILLGFPEKLSSTSMPLVISSPRQTQPFPLLPLTCGCSC